MLYVSGIIWNGNRQNVFVSSGRYDNGLTVEVTNSETGAVSTFAGRDIVHIDRMCLGFIFAGARSVFVKYTPAAVSFYKYLNYVGNETKCKFNFRYNFIEKKMTLSRDEIHFLEALDLYNIYVVFLSETSSVVSFRDDAYEVKYMNLYDFVIELCKSTGVDITGFGTVIFLRDNCHEYGHYMSFSHTSEACRFYAKMQVLG